MNTFLFNAKIKRFFKVRIYKPKKLFSWHRISPLFSCVIIASIKNKHLKNLKYDRRIYVHLRWNQIRKDNSSYYSSSVSKRKYEVSERSENPSLSYIKWNDSLRESNRSGGEGKYSCPFFYYIYTFAQIVPKKRTVNNKHHHTPLLRFGGACLPRSILFLHSITVPLFSLFILSFHLSLNTWIMIRARWKSIFQLYKREILILNIEECSKKEDKKEKQIPSNS